ncbi:hypothetical protein ACFXKI_32525 [Streptomyces mirabilis]|uniref:hypothetical protein n=1 Tax=Streptomyces mirabilis TaxID=68239 RepID=UPI0036A05697
MSQGNLAAVLISGIVLAAACYAIRRKPARVAAVIIALAALVGALKPIIQILTEQPRPMEIVAPAVPGTPVSSAPPAALANSPAPVSPPSSWPYEAGR